MFKIKPNQKFISFILRPSKAGFSLIEIMTVLFVISIGLIGVLSLIVQNIQSQNINKDALIAYQLSQEGIELVRRTRDTNWLAGQPWNTNLAPGHYVIDYQDSIPQSITISGQEYLKQDGLGFYYNQDVVSDSNPTSVFSRTVDLIVNPANANSIFVQTLITWTNRDKHYNYVTETTLYDWK